MSRDPRVDTYITDAAPFARPILEKTRNLIHEVIPEIDETIKWGKPAYTLAGKILVVTAAFKAHASVSFWRSNDLGLERSKTEGMGQLGKLYTVDDLPSDKQFEKLLRSAAALSAQAPRTERDA